MVKLVHISFLLMVSFLHLVNNVEISPMLEMLDAMQLMMTGEEFDRVYYEELINCMDFLDPAIKPSQDGAWQGIMDYWDTRGTIQDPWGQKDTAYIEENVTSTAIRGMTIYEPCGYSSNVAYYYPVTGICNRYTNGKSFSIPQKLISSMGNGFSQLAMGSAFMHGTHTRLGSRLDGRTLAVVAYQIHQASLDALDQSPVLHHLDRNFREFTAYEMTQKLSDMFTNTDVTEWQDISGSLGIPDYRLIYAAIISTILTLTFDPIIVDFLIQMFANLFGAADDIVIFISNFYLPELRIVTADLNINIFRKKILLADGIGTLIKLLYAFVWQERVIIRDPIIFTPTANLVGIALLPKVNKLCSAFQSFQHFNQDFQNGIDIYPGDKFCNPVLPHPKWHLQSAVGLLDLVNLADEMHKTLSKL